ncbi:MAG: M48 family metalloprotease [Bacteroidales bacterium]|nr:M48 family metalloprotease [Bacteroidales bacterium]
MKLSADYKDIEDRELVRLALENANQEAVLYIIYVRYVPLLKKLCRKYYDNLFYLEQLQAELFIHLRANDWCALRSFRWKSSFGSWLGVVAGHLFVEKIPELRINWDYSINACTIGAERPVIILGSGWIDLCDDDEIMFVVSHELGHIKSNHMLYHMMAQMIDIIIDSIPGGTLLAGGLQYALYYWNRMSEFTADRAGLLGCQNHEAMIRAFVKMAGLPLKEFNSIKTESFIQQARDFKMLDYDGMNKVVKFISIADETHPWTVMRSAELLKWMESGEYNRFLTHCYLR